MRSYMTDQADITASMRAILVDWLIEVQENFELFHETLYLAELTDRYLCRAQVKREYLQLVGATCMLIAAKFEVRTGTWVGGAWSWVGGAICAGIRSRGNTCN